MGEDQNNGVALVPTADIGPVREDVANKARELAFAALELEQLALLDEVPFEEGLMLPEPEQRKRYTATQANNNLLRRDACLYMLGRSCPAQDIARILRMNLRTVAALASQHGRVIAGFTEAYAQELIASAGSDIALAESKRHEASYKDLHIGAGIKLTHASSLKAASGGGDLNPAIEVETVSPELESARKFLSLRTATGKPKAELPAGGEAAK